MGLAVGPSACIISVGNEILIGKTVNTNAAWLGRKLTLLGYRVVRCLVVPDEIDDIVWAFKTAVNLGARVVISTGGLGPTFDDKTAEGVAAAFGLELELNEKALKMVREKYRNELTEPRVKMARIPKGSKPIYNPVGTAPGIHLEVQGCDIFVLPGVPKEMEAMFEGYVEPLLRKIGPKLHFAERLLRSTGVRESDAAPLINKAMKVAHAVYIKSHPRGSELGTPVLELHITASGPSPEEAERSVDAVARELARLLEERGARVEWIKTG